MIMSPLISVCIPAYKNVTFLKRLLDSLEIQSFEDFEVLISDDSPDNAVQELVAGYEGRLPGLRYWHNRPAKGMPENWNTVIDAAKGTWIKIMHDDDWLLTPGALGAFAAATDTTADFIFCNYENNFMGGNGEIEKKVDMFFPKYQLERVTAEPLLLLAENIVGPPSVCMVRASAGARYDARLRWRVDIDYYKNVLVNNPSAQLLEDILVGVGMNPEQITNQTKNIPEVELPEALILTEKYGTASLRNWRIYDSWWRMFRNMHIYSYVQLQQYAPGPWPPVITSMLGFIEKLPKIFFKTGVTSKLSMLVSFLVNKGVR